MTDKPQATRPGSKWATGKRRVLDSKQEPKGFSQGARVYHVVAPSKTRRKRK